MKKFFILLIWSYDVLLTGNANKYCVVTAFDDLYRMEMDIKESGQYLFEVFKENSGHVGLNLVFRDIKMAGSITEGSFAARLFQTDLDFPDLLHREFELDFEMTMFELDEEDRFAVREIQEKPGFSKIIILQKDGRVRVSEEVRNFFASPTTPTELQDYINPEGYLLSNKIKAEYNCDMFQGKSDHNYIKFTKLAAAYITKAPIEHISHSKYNSKFTKATTTFGFDLYIKNRLQLKVSSDFAFVFKLNWRLNIYKSLIERWRNTSVPVNTLTQELNVGYVIAKPSNEERTDLDSTEFRYSFAHIERKLISLQSRTQRIVYLMFKALLYGLLKPIDPEQISSYLCKCTMFWLVEKQGLKSSLWTDDSQSMHKALKQLLRKLLAYFEHTFMPYYFVPQINVLEHLSNETTVKIIKKLKVIIKNPPQYLKKAQIGKAKVFLQDTLQSFNVVKTLIQDVKMNGPYMFFFERPDLYHLLKDHHKTSRLGYHQRKKINFCRLQSPFERQEIDFDRQCYMKKPLRSMIFSM